MAHTYFDVSDVIVYFESNVAASGIQRVQLEFIRQFSMPGHDDYAFVIENGLAFTLLDKALLGEFLNLIDGTVPTRLQLNRLISRIKASNVKVVMVPGDILFVSGAFWISASTSRSWMQARAQGARVGFLCYDLIPLTYPEFCVEGLVDAYSYAIDSVFHVTDFVFTISEHVKTEVERHLQGMNLDLPVIALPLAHELAPVKGEPHVRAVVRDLAKKRYVLFVSTIEARKNHAYTLTLWQQLLATMAADDVPDLVWVGRAGWMVSDLMMRVDRLHHLDGKLHILNQLSDNELKALYEGCWFTIYPSFAEGWGLPVAESLVFGKPCIASNTTSIPEVGGDFVWYIDPLNITAGVDLVTSLIRHPERVEAAARRLRQDFKPRSWADVAVNLMAGFATLRALPRQEIAFDMALTPGVYPLGGGKDNQARLSSRERATLDLMCDGWYNAETWGRWLKGQDGRLSLVRAAASSTLASATNGGDCLLYFKLQAVGHWRGHRLLMTCPQAGFEAVLRPAAGTRDDFYVTMPLPDGPVDFTFQVDRVDVGSGADPRPLSVGLVAFGFAPLADQSACQVLADARESGRPQTHVGIQPIGTAPPFPRRQTSPRAYWLTYVAKRAMQENPLTTAARVVRRIKMHLVG
jgi:glycosyltransferase involved in cell wall biosynthesis